MENKIKAPSELELLLSTIPFSKVREQLDALKVSPNMLMSGHNTQNLIEKLAKSRRHEALNWCLKLADADALLELSHYSKVPAFFFVMQTNNPEAIELTLKKVPSVYFKNPFGQNVLSQYVRYAGIVTQSTISTIIDTAKAEVPKGIFEFINDKDNWGKTAFSNLVVRVCQMEQSRQKDNAFKVLRTLFREGADINLADNSHISPLLWTCIEDDLEAFKLVASLGGDPALTSVSGDNCMYHAIVNDNTEMQEAILKLFDKRKLPIIKCDDKSPIFEALRCGKDELALELILASPESMEHSDSSRDHHTCLIYAIKHGSAELVSNLCQLGADVNQSNDHSITPLMYCAYNYKQNPELYSEMARTLINYKADFDAMDNNGQTVFDVCKNQGLTNLEALLNYEQNIRLIADRMHGGDIEQAKKTMVDLGGGALDQLCNHDFINTPTLTMIEDGVRIRRGEAAQKRLDDISEGRRLILSGLAQNIPILMGAQILSAQTWSQQNHISMAMIASTCSAAHYLLSFSKQDRQKMMLATQHMINQIDTKILEPIRDIERKVYIQTNFKIEDKLNAIRLKWKTFKKGLQSILNILSFKNKRDLRQTDNTKAAQLTKADLAIILQEFKQMDEQQLNLDSRMVQTINEKLAMQSERSKQHSRESNEPENSL